jgi:hypothetical protein
MWYRPFLKKNKKIASLRDRHTLSMPYVVSLWQLVPPGRISYQKGEETVRALWRLVPSRTTGANLVPKGWGDSAGPLVARTISYQKGERLCGSYISGLCYGKRHHSSSRSTTGWSCLPELLVPAYWNFLSYLPTRTSRTNRFFSEPERQISYHEISYQSALIRARRKKQRTRKATVFARKTTG